MEFTGKCRLNTSLIVAVVFGQTEAARLLIEKGADVNVKNKENVPATLDSQN